MSGNHVCNIRINLKCINCRVRDFIIDHICPLLNEIGFLWEKGDLKVSSEHFASTIIANVLGALIETPKTAGAPSVVVGTPLNQNHELMAMAISVLVSTAGFNVIYIGASVPAEEIISTAEKTNALAVVLSIIYPNDDYALIDELKKLDTYLENTDIYAGGSSAKEYLDKLGSSKISYINDIEKFLKVLQSSRRLA